MQITQRRFTASTRFDFGDDSVQYTIKDSSGSRSIGVDYLDFKRGSGTVEERNAWWRNAGILWVVIGVVQVSLRLARSQGPGLPFWLLLGLACLAVYRFGRASYSFHDTPEGRVFIMKGRQHDRILDEMETRRKQRLKKLHGAIDLARSPDQEVAKFKWLAEQGAITADERDQRIAQVLAAARTETGPDEQDMMTVN